MTKYNKENFILLILFTAVLDTPTFLLCVVFGLDATILSTTLIVLTIVQLMAIVYLIFKKIR